MRSGGNEYYDIRETKTNSLQQNGVDVIHDLGFYRSANSKKHG